MESSRIVITGGTGFLGLNLAGALASAGYEPVLVSRSKPKGEVPWQYVPWDGRNVGDWTQQLEGARAIVNLAGRTVDCSKTPDHCDEILRSRVESTRAIGLALRTLSNPPPVWVQMSTAHIYGDPPQGIECSERSAFGYGLAPHVGQAWEKAFQESVLPGMRQVIARTSFVLGRTGGAVQRLAQLAKWGLGGTVGQGTQGMSWIHEEDMNRFFLQAISDESMEGAYLSTAPNPVSNKEFMKELRRVCGRKIGLPAAAWMVRLGAPLLLKTDPELALYGRYCVSERLKDEGFEFHFPDLPSALDDLFNR